MQLPDSAWVTAPMPVGTFFTWLVVAGGASPRTGVVSCVRP
jgi:hypothetical protein